MTSVTVARHRTAIHRSEMSRPIRAALADGLINPKTDVFDYGCGYGDDLEHLRRQDIKCSGWDPAHRPDAQRNPADVVNLGYVINVIENPDERKKVLTESWELARRLLIVSARLTIEAKDEAGTPFADGLITRIGTFQRFYEQHELREWIDSSLNVSSIPAAPGVFYVFRDQSLHQSFIASRYRRRTAAPRVRRSDILYEQNKELLNSLIDFLTTRGRLPDATELETAVEICQHFGSLKRAWNVVRSITGEEQWESIRLERSQDLLIYLALSRFGNRPALSQLPRDLQFDIKAFFSTYKHACTLADELLFSAGKPETIEAACRQSPVGKLTPNALYLHISALMSLPPVLRIYEGCARAYIGAVDGANIIKLHRRKPQVSYLSYPDFERDPHPALSASLVVPLQSLHIYYREYSASVNPPILHRKEEFVSEDFPMRTKFERLTKQEEKWGLYDNQSAIGNKQHWEALLSSRGIKLAGHRLIRRHSE
jgi:DNA phosphorothioation-associated putative methyltransferase